MSAIGSAVDSVISGIGSDISSVVGGIGSAIEGALSLNPIIAATKGAGGATGGEPANLTPPATAANTLLDGGNAALNGLPGTSGL